MSKTVVTFEDISELAVRQKALDDRINAAEKERRAIKEDQRDLHQALLDLWHRQAQVHRTDVTKEEAE